MAFVAIAAIAMVEYWGAIATVIVASSASTIALIEVLSQLIAKRILREPQEAPAPAGLNEKYESFVAKLATGEDTSEVARSIPGRGLSAIGPGVH